MKLNMGRLIPSRSGGAPDGESSSPEDGAPPAAESASASSGGSMKIGTKIFALVGFCLALLGVVAGTSIWQLNKVAREIEAIAEVDLPLTEGLLKITIHQLEQAVNFERAFRTGEEMANHPASREEFEKSVRHFEELTIKIEKEFDEVKITAKNAYESALTPEDGQVFSATIKNLEALHKEHKDYDHEVIQSFKLIHAGKINQALDLVPKIEAEQEDLDTQLEKMIFEVEKLTEHGAIRAEHIEQFALKLQMVLSIVSLVAGIVFAIFLVKRSISRPLTEIVAGLDALNADDMSVDVKVYNDDEIGAVAKAYVVFKANMIRTKQLEADQVVQKQRAEEEQREMMNKLADDFDTNVGGIIETVSSASAELNSTAQSMASISEETSSQASAVAAASEEASTNVQTVASATDEMANTIREINQQVADASQASKKAVEDVATTAGQMKTLAETADKIGDVISLIQDIAEQTNLLALNATIESARAGEAGKGFAVVASEVKALANETAKATENISEHIQEIQSATGDAVTSIDDIGNVIRQIEESSSAIAAAMEEQGATTQEVARNVQEAASGTQEVTSNISGVTQASQEAGAASGQVTSAAAELSKQSELMKTEVTKFLEQVRAA